METGKRYVFNQLLLILMVILVGLLFLAAGLMIGYAILGDGRDALNILKPDTWHNIIAKFTGQ